eukprot:TRINITY_DN9040_c0_g2_i1.p1 TRINITY_DN9040_c0_g2~~TRINITY_DN9040_c0_g2_i1.p1  ORF type:complete len:818 (+),score=91.61 TRINITY_DN9040_c0_g2_i1:338-2791(+)
MQCIASACSSGQCACEDFHFEDACGAMDNVCRGVGLTCSQDTAQCTGPSGLRTVQGPSVGGQHDAPKPAAATPTAPTHEDLPDVQQSPLHTHAMKEFTVTGCLLGNLSYILLMCLIAYCYRGKKGIPPQEYPYQGDEFTHGFCACCEDVGEGGDICLCGWCCPGVRWAQTVSHPKVNFLAFWPALLIFMILAVLSGCVSTAYKSAREGVEWTAIFGYLLLLLGVYHRQKLRAVFGHSPGTLKTVFLDLLAWHCCPCCAIIQEAKEVDYVLPGQAVPKNVIDRDATKLSNIGQAVYAKVQKDHKIKWQKSWNVTTGKVVGEVLQTPHGKISWPSKSDPPVDHDDWFPKRFFEVMSKTQVWCDVTSLAPPDDEFMTQFQAALQAIARNAVGKQKPIVVRMLFGNIVGMPVNCDSIIQELTKDLRADVNIQLWVGAWRKGASWNHSKIIAVDGKHLLTGGHNMWTKHYLKRDPIHDISMELEGRVTHDGHLFANEHWRFIEFQQSTIVGKVVEHLPDGAPMLLPVRVTVSEWGLGATTYPPAYDKSLVPSAPVASSGEVPMISLGRFGSMMPPHASDDSFVAMFDAAQHSVQMALQDLGPITVLGIPGPIAVPGIGWPRAYLEALGRGIWERDIQVEIALSNPNSTPDGLSVFEAPYGNGWSTADVAAEVIKTIPRQYKSVDETVLRRKIRDNLRVCYIKQKKGNKWDSGMTMGMHAKHFIVDQKCYYIGSQNLYMADLAEWGVVIDDVAQTQKCMAEYWNPLWSASHTNNDFLDSDAVLSAIDVDRDGKAPEHLDSKTKAAIEETQRAQHRVPAGSKHH